MSAIRFEAEWERIHSEMIEVGLPIGATEKLIAYIQTIGPPVWQTVRLDRRPRADGSGGTTVHLPETPEECHEVLRELEQVTAASRASSAACVTDMQSCPPVPEPYENQAGGQGGGKG